MARADVDEARMLLLAHVVDQYMKLSDAEAQELAALGQSSTSTEVRQMVLSWTAKAHQEGLEQGRSLGLSAGRPHGEQAVLLRLMRRRFGPVPADVVARVEAIEDTEALEAIADRILDARTLDEVGLPEV